jgi:hypothetical protein
VICENLVNCNSRIINTSPSLISTIMQNLNGKTRSNDKRSSSDPDSADGLQNFAPLGKSYYCSTQILVYLFFV